jgi:hypothetical protein
LDIDVITALLKDESIARAPVKSSGEVVRLFQALAFEQLQAIASRAVYRGYGYLSPWLFAEDVEDKPVGEVSRALYARMSASRGSMPDEEEGAWVKKFEAEVAAAVSRLRLEWEPKWKEVCDGKRLFKDLQGKGVLKVSVSALKRRIIQRMKETKSENWRLVESQLKTLLKKA